MTREEHLVFCKKCHNRKFDFQTGLKCGLTDELADFEETCENFSHDESVKEEIQVEERTTAEIIDQLPPDIVSRLRPHQDLFYAIVGGFFVSLICALLWAVITVSTEYQIAYMAIALGLAVGMSVRFFGAGVDSIFGYIGGFLALIGCLLGNLFSQVGFIADMESLGYLETLMLLDFETILAIYEESFSPIDLLFYGVAAYEGYKFAFRTIPENIASLEDLTPPNAKYRLPLVIVCFVITSFAFYTFSKGINGPQRFYYDSGLMMAEGAFVDGKKEGTWTYYYESGKEQTVAEYKSDIEYGDWVWYYESGSVMRQGSFVNGLVDGLWLNYAEGGALSDSTYYKTGRKHGSSITYYENGEVAQQGKYSRERRDGKWVFYFDNGVVSSEGSLDNGELTGRWTFNNYQGKKTQEIDYVNTKEYSIVTIWNPKGKKIVSEGNGVFMSYDDNGNISQKGTIKNGQKDGLWTNYFSNGKKEEEGSYEDGQYLLENAWGFDGKQILKDGNGEYIGTQEGSDYPTIKGQIKDGLKEGYWATYQFNSDLLQNQSIYKNGKLNGAVTSYFPDGNISVSGQYENDEEIGDWKWYHENGLISSQVFYMAGKKEGTQTFWSESGHSAKEEVYELGELVSEKLINDPNE